VQRIRINVQDPNDRIVVKEGDKKNISVIKNIFLKRKAKRWKSDVDINQDSWGIVGWMQLSSKFGWLGTPNNGMPSEFSELGINLRLSMKALGWIWC